MRRHRNTLYVATDGAWIRKDGENIVVEIDGAEAGRAPIHLIGGIVCFGRVSVSPPLMGACTARGVAITHLTEHGRFLARIEGPVSGNVLLRRAQHRTADDGAAALLLARSFVLGKILNQRTVLRRALRDLGPASAEAETDRAILTAGEAALSDALTRAARQDDLDALRGVEGDAARRYFDCFRALVRADRKTFAMTGRSRRPPLDPVNALLSFLYALLTHDCRSALETVGLDPAVGYLHADRPGRPSLALDLMEEFRPVIADRTVLTLINRRQLGEGDFRDMEGGAVLLTDEARKTVLTAYQERKKTELRHDFLREQTTLGLCPHLQALLLARRLRNDLDAYPPFIWK